MPCASDDRNSLGAMVKRMKLPQEWHHVIQAMRPIAIYIISQEHQEEARKPRVPMLWVREIDDSATADSVDNASGTERAYWRCKPSHKMIQYGVLKVRFDLFSR